ncbi:ribosomal-protein-alanine N-acetyltransferase [Mycetocola sp. BIGb0189]|uniref:GNAT family N-acetyltransferase n=1 Tax=Mycetocola sp. BIGb0189 TaxID=2940604 RepID=UPI00216852E6|nr:GNAT family protein [Mycetocola sp. BIGb0189]MCS4277463.1 ribosomal-protein-alanine N-acetyltransferase [Mycetocola sp. BIGb0189]
MASWSFQPQQVGDIVLRGVKLRDAKALERELLGNRSWLAPWEATSPRGMFAMDVRASIRDRLAAARAGESLPLIMEYRGELAGQLTVSGLTYGSLASASLGYWISERFAGKGITPTAVALATDYTFRMLGLHRMEICIRPENAPSLAVVRKLGFRYEGLRRRYIHINGDWRDHYCFAVVAEEAPEGVYARWRMGLADPHLAEIPEADRLAASLPLEY